MPRGSPWCKEPRSPLLFALCCALAALGAAAKGNSVYKDNIVSQLIADHEHAQEYVASRWSDLEGQALPCLRASSAGQLGPKSTFSKSFHFVLKQTDVDALVDRGVPVYRRGCTAWVSHKYKFIYLRLLKSASSTVLGALFQSICSKTDQSGGARCKPDELTEVPNLKAGSPEALEVDRWWREYFVFSFVRNPWSRLSSAYFMFTSRDLMHRRLPDDTPGDVCGPELPFAEVAKHAGAIGDLCDKADCCTFSEIEGWKPFSAYVHVHDQYHCLFDVNGRVMVDYIGTAEDLDFDFKTVISEIRRRSGRDVEIPDLRPHNVRSDATTGKPIDPNKRARECSMEHYPHMDKDILRDIAQQYALTAVRFGYINGYVPQLQAPQTGAS